MNIYIYYDGECPVCSNYVKFLRLRETVEDVVLVDLREENTERARLEERGYDLDQGMVVDIDGKLYAGADAVNRLALLSTPVGIFNRLNALAHSNSIVASILYPVLRAGRWCILFGLGRKAFDKNDSKPSSHFQLFNTFFAIFSIFHFFNYAFEYSRFPPELDQLALLISAIILFFFPGSSRALFLLVLTSTISTVVQAPVQSNHTMVRSFLLMGYWLSFLYAMLSNKKSSDIFKNLILAGQATLLGMYFFGIFHKINTDFLTPETSCAVTLWHKMPAPLNLLQGSFIDYTAIYGTFIAEGIILIMLLKPKLRHYGITLGILFHLLLGLSSYAMYISFTTLSIVLHIFFLNEEGAQKVFASREFKLIQERKTNPMYIIAALTLLTVMAFFAALKQYSMVTFLILPLVLPFCYVIIRKASSKQKEQSDLNIRPAFFIGATIGILFLANGFMPYLGLKTAQSVNMFANLRLEKGVSNHLVFPEAPGPFTYLEEVALIEDSGDDRLMNYHKRKEIGIVYYDLLAHLSNNPELKISFTMGGKQFENVSAEDLASDIKSTIHSPWIRKWLHFQPAKLTQPETCNV